MYTLLEVLKKIKNENNAKYVIFQGYQRPTKKGDPLFTSIDIAINNIENNPEYEEFRSGERSFSVEDKSISYNGLKYFMSYASNEENYPIKQRIESYEKCKCYMNKKEEKVPVVAYRMQEKVLNK